MTVFSGLTAGVTSSDIIIGCILSTLIICIIIFLVSCNNTVHYNDIPGELLEDNDDDEDDGEDDDEDEDSDSDSDEMSPELEQEISEMSDSINEGLNVVKRKAFMQNARIRRLRIKLGVI